MKEMYKDNAGNWHYGYKGEKLSEVSYSTNSVPNSISIEWIEEYIKSLVIKRRFLAENGYRDNRCYDYMFGIIGMLGDWDTEIREKENEL